MILGFQKRPLIFFLKKRVADIYSWKKVKEKKVKKKKKWREEGRETEGEMEREREREVYSSCKYYKNILANMCLINYYYTLYIN